MALPFVAAAAATAIALSFPRTVIRTAVGVGAFALIAVLALWGIPAGFQFAEAMGWISLRR